MQLDLTGKHALVCGASEGIGRATAIELAVLGADVTVLARRENALREVIAQLDSRRGQQHDALIADMADRDGLRDAVGSLAQHKPIHILINNTGGPPAGRAIDADLAAYLDAYGKHLLANQTLTQAVVPGMRDAGYGRIINVISTSVYEPIPNLGVSNTTRAAVAGWAKTLARELGPEAITVNNVLPGFTETGRIAQIVGNEMQKTGNDEASVRQRMTSAVPLGRFAEPHETASLIAFLASPAAGYISGQSIAVDGGRMNSI